MSNTDFQNGFALGMLSGGIVKHNDNAGSYLKQKLNYSEYTYGNKLLTAPTIGKYIKNATKQYGEVHT